MKDNTVYTKGFVNDNGCIEIPGVFLEDCAEVELAIKVKSGHFEIAMFPSRENEEHQQDCGISEEEIMRVCSAHDDCSDCPLKEYCGEEFANDEPYISENVRNPRISDFCRYNEKGKDDAE